MDFSFIPLASAATPLLDTTSSYTTTDMIRIAISLIVLVAGLCAVFFIIWGGLMLILSGGKKEKVDPALSTIRYSVIGIIAIVIAIFVIPKFTELLGIAGVSDYLSPKSIFDTISLLAQRIFGDPNATFIPSNTLDTIEFIDR